MTQRLEGQTRPSLSLAARTSQRFQVLTTAISSTIGRAKTSNLGHTHRSRSVTVGQEFDTYPKIHSLQSRRSFFTLRARDKMHFAETDEESADFEPKVGSLYTMTLAASSDTKLFQYHHHSPRPSSGAVAPPYYFRQHRRSESHSTAVHSPVPPLTDDISKINPRTLSSSTAIADSTSLTPLPSHSHELLQINAVHLSDTSKEAADEQMAQLSPNILRSRAFWRPDSAASNASKPGSFDDSTESKAELIGEDMKQHSLSTMDQKKLPTSCTTTGLAAELNFSTAKLPASVTERFRKSELAKRRNLGRRSRSYTAPPPIHSHYIAVPCGMDKHDTDSVCQTARELTAPCGVFVEGALPSPPVGASPVDFMSMTHRAGAL